MGKKVEQLFIATLGLPVTSSCESSPLAQPRAIPAALPTPPLAAAGTLLLSRWSLGACCCHTGGVLRGIWEVKEVKHFMQTHSVSL